MHDLRSVLVNVLHHAGHFLYCPLSLLNRTSHRWYHRIHLIPRSMADRTCAAYAKDRKRTREARARRAYRA